MALENISSILYGEGNNGTEASIIGVFKRFGTGDETMKGLLAGTRGLYGVASYASHHEAGQRSKIFSALSQYETEKMRHEVEKLAASKDEVLAALQREIEMMRHEAERSSAAKDTALAELQQHVVGLCGQMEASVKDQGRAFKQRINGKIFRR